jgi:hypothetical protein
VKNVETYSRKKYPLFLSDCNETLIFSTQFTGKKSSNIKFHQNPSNGSRVVPCGQTDGVTDMTKLIVAVRNFANASYNFFKIYFYNFLRLTLR